MLRKTTVPDQQLGILNRLCMKCFCLHGIIYEINNDLTYSHHNARGCSTPPPPWKGVGVYKALAVFVLQSLRMRDNTSLACDVIYRSGHVLFICNSISIGQPQYSLTFPSRCHLLAFLKQLIVLDFFQSQILTINKGIASKNHAFYNLLLTVCSRYYIVIFLKPNQHRRNIHQIDRQTGRRQIIIHIIYTLIHTLT